MFKTSLRLFAGHSTAASVVTPIVRTKTSTTITGLPIHPCPFPYLTSVYHSTLSLLSTIPPGALYRQSVESITQERLDLIERFGLNGTEEGIRSVEEKVGLGCVEELIIMAESELSLVGKMLEWKA